MWQTGSVPRPSGVALLLSRLGEYSSTRFAARIAELGLTPSQVGVLRVVGQNPGLSQQAVSQRLGSVPSRIVQLVDELEARGLVERRRSATDRRNYELHVPESAADRIAEILSTVAAHDAAMIEGLSAQEVRTLRDLLAKLADHNGLHLG